MDWTIASANSMYFFRIVWNYPLHVPLDFIFSFFILWFPPTSPHHHLKHCFFCLLISPQPFYTSRTGLAPSAGPRGVPPSSAPRPVTPTHVYQAGPGSQMMMIPQQQLSFPSSPQGAAFFIPGQVSNACKMRSIS